MIDNSFKFSLQILNLFHFLFFFFSFSIQPLIQAGDFTGGAFRSIENGTFTGDGVVGHLLNGVSHSVIQLACSALGPDFLQILLNHHNCPNGAVLPTIFKSYQKFCEFYKNACPTIKKCLTDAAVKIRLNVKGVVDILGLIGKCCASCGGNGEFNVKIKNAYQFARLIHR